jgi:hypothetical protein
MNAPTNSDILWGKIRLAEGRLFAATFQFWNHPDLPRLLPRFLIQTHYLMRSGLSMMTSARSRALDLPDDAVASDLAAYLCVHLEEETGHDLWLLNDILTLGFTEPDVLEARPCAASTALIGAQYFWMTHVHPVAIMGYLILMEGYAPVSSQLEEIRLRSGAPASAFRCLQRHAEDDPAHLADLNRTLDGMNLTGQQARAVGMCAFAAIDGLAAMFEELIAKSAENPAAAIEPPGELLHAGA